MSVDGRLQQARVLVVGMGGLAAELCKNLVLAGVGGLTMMDDTIATEEDLTAQFLIDAADVGHKTGRRGGLLYIAVLATFVGIPAALFPIMPGVGGFQLAFFCLLLAGTTVSVVASTAVAVLIPNEERGACMAAFSVIGSIVGAGLAPTIVSIGSTLMGGEQHLAKSLAVTGVVTGVMSFAGYVLAMRNAPKSATEWR